MKEKEIKEFLDNKYESMAPDFVDKICSEPRKPIKSEAELFGDNEPLFKEKKKAKIVWAGFATLAAACMIAFIITIIPTQSKMDKTVAFYVTIDVNPSISIDVNEAGEVVNVRADNKDAQKIVNEVYDNAQNGEHYGELVNKVIGKLCDNGYLTKKKTAMLVSVVSKDEKDKKDAMKEVKNSTEKYQVEHSRKFVTIYQKCKTSKKIEKIAKKNNISQGKAALCDKISKVKDDDVEKYCDKSITRLAKELVDSGIANDESGISIVTEPTYVPNETGYIEQSTFMNEDLKDIETLVEETDIETETMEGEENTTENKDDSGDMPLDDPHNIDGYDNLGETTSSEDAMHINP